jgi:ABC-type Na+ efflux pump permease subunit
MGFSVVTAKRGLRLGLSYVLLSFVMLVPAGLLSGSAALNLPTHGVPAEIDLKLYLSLLSVPLVSLTAVIASMPVSLLYVHDKDNGTLEYLLSMGLDQTDIFRGYLGASLLLGSVLLATGVVLELVTGIASGIASTLLLTQVVLTIALGYSVISLVSILMSAFSSLQKQPVGANQPLGIAVGALFLVAAMIVPAVMPALTLVLELGIAGLVALLSLSLLFLSGRLIRREKMLP